MSGFVVGAKVGLIYSTSWGPDRVTAVATVTKVHKNGNFKANFPGAENKQFNPSYNGRIAHATGDYQYRERVELLDEQFDANRKAQQERFDAKRRANELEIDLKAIRAEGLSAENFAALAALVAKIKEEANQA